MLARGIEVFLLGRIFAREGLQIGYRFVEKWGAGCRGQGEPKRKGETEKGETEMGRRGMKRWGEG
jgi:hypothetical protein